MAPRLHPFTHALGLATVACGLTSATQTPDREERSGWVYQPAFERALVALRDMDGDGVTEYAILVLAGDREGEIAVLSGASNRLLYSIAGEKDVDLPGCSIFGIDDVDGDTVPDIVVGSPGAIGSMSPHGSSRTREGPFFVKLFSGKSGSAFATHDGWWKAKPVCDTDGDGIEDLLLAAPDEHSTSNGKVELLSVRTGKVIRSVDAPACGTLVDKQTIQFGFLASRCGEELAVASYQDTLCEKIWLFLYDRTGEAVKAKAGFPRAQEGPLRALRYLDGAPGKPGALLAISELGTLYWLSPTSLEIRFEVAGQKSELRIDDVEPILEVVGDLDGDGAPDIVVGPFDSKSADEGGKELRLLSGIDGKQLGTVACPMAFGCGACAITGADGIPELLLTWLTDMDLEKQVQRIRRVALRSGVVEWDVPVDQLVSASKK